MSTHNIGFYEKISKIISKLSSNTHLISSADCLNIGVFFIYGPSTQSHILSHFRMGLLT